MWRSRYFGDCASDLFHRLEGRFEERVGFDEKVSQQMQDRFARLKALRPPSPSNTSEVAWQPALPHIRTQPQTARAVPDGSDRLEQILGTSAKANQYGEHLVLHSWFGEPARYTPDLQALRLLMPNPAEDLADPEQWLFLDIETTGLAGGSGTYAFLVGVAWWEAGGLEIEQFFMRDYSEECSLLFALGERLAERRVLVTFNGKSFDWPLLETRYRMNRKIPPPVPLAHLDFLHPARNLWRLRLGSVRLSGLERHVLGWDRGADLTSDLIPRIYLDFVRGAPPEQLIPVFHHNQMDLRGLAGLSSRILSLLSDVETQGEDGLELFGVSRICERRGDSVRARKLYEKSIATVLPAETDRSARRLLARLAKRDGDFAVACELWSSALGNSFEGYEAYEQLAIYHEHNARDPRRAREIVCQALDELRRANRTGTINSSAYHQISARFERRMGRLERKSMGPLLNVVDMGLRSGY
jgi:uncharacterized protein YprB with RNaseH-like and TPR domain